MVESVPTVTFRRLAYSAQHGPYCHQRTFDLCLPCYELMWELLEPKRHKEKHNG